jgi:hypothetical protein
VTVLVFLLALSGCTAPTDPYVATVTQTVEQTVFKSTGSMASGCVGVNLFCVQPMYEPVFFAPATTNVDLVCQDLLAIASKLGVVAYGASGYSAYEFPDSNIEVLEICKNGLGAPLKNFDGTDFYQGLVLYDDGSKDSFGKVYSLSGGPSEFGDGFVLIISFSKDLGRVGPVQYGSGKPQLLTQADLDAQNAVNNIAAETMKIANPLLGKDEQYAKTKIEEAGLTWVIVDRDGKELPTDKMYNPKRVRLTIREGKIYDAIAG